jgi:hypothetical protein
MDNLFKSRVLTAAINEMFSPSMMIYRTLFAGKEHMEATDRLAFDVITGSEDVLGEIAVEAPATVTDHNSRKTVTVTAPRLAQKRFISSASLNALRGYGEPVATAQMQQTVARELQDMRLKHDRTLEMWAADAMKGQIYDNDRSTVLVDYNMSDSHKPTLSGTELWTNASSDPIENLRTWKRMIEDDSGTGIDSFLAFVGFNAMTALLDHDNIRDYFKYTEGSRIAQMGRISNVAEVDMKEYNGSYKDKNSTRRRFIPEDYIMLVGVTPDITDMPYAPVVDDDAPGGVGNSGAGRVFFSKSWKEKDPSGRWIKTESRPLPVLQRPGCVVYAKVV